MNKVLVDLGFIEIRWYSFLIFVAAIVGGFLAIKEAKKRKISEDFMINYIFYMIPLGIIGARLYYVIFSFKDYQDNLLDIFKIWKGGLAIHGGIIAGLIWTYFYTRKHKIYFFKVTDIVAVSIIICQAIGRWGNFFNGEAHGGKVSLEFLQSLHLPQFIIDGMYLDPDLIGEFAYYHPTFLYESLWCILGFIIMLLIRKNKKLIVGYLTGFYLIWYSFGRFFIESLRTDSLMFFNIRIAQLISIVGILLGITVIIVVSSLKKLKIKYYEEKI